MTSSAGTVAGVVTRIGWVVDVQRDFMEPDGRLYVRDLGDASDPGATTIVATLGDAVAWMRENCIVIVYTGDWHALDGEGFRHVKIVVSGGFDADKIRRFKEAGVPVDSYGVGSTLVRGSYDFTADIVLVEGSPSAKTGRWHRPNPRMDIVS